MAVRSPAQLKSIVARAVRETPVFDLHTHLFSPAFESLLLWGPDELLTYHYLIAEVLRTGALTPEEFYRLDAARRADAIWRELFLKRAPVSEACRGVITSFKQLGAPLAGRRLNDVRRWYKRQKLEPFVKKVFRLANLEAVVMTNDPFDEEEEEVWLRSPPRPDKRFRTSLRLDYLLLHWDQAVPYLKKRGYKVTRALTAATKKEVKRFLEEWIGRVRPLYSATSLPPGFTAPARDHCGRMLEEVLLPLHRECNLPFGVMIGVRRRVNPRLKKAGDVLGRSEVSAVEHLCRQWPDNRFLVTMLSAENQHELAVLARKFSNLFLFGCWWYLNVPSQIAAITRLRLELLGLQFTPQNSDCRVLDQLVYKWAHLRQVLTGVLTEKYLDLQAAGWPLTAGDVQRDVARLLNRNFKEFVGL